MDISIFKEENIIKEIGHGVEGIVYLYNDNGNIVALKKFYTKKEIYKMNNTIYPYEYTSFGNSYGIDNKELKLMILKNEPLLKNDISLLNRVYYKDKFIGFTSVYDPYTPLSFIDKKKNKIKALRLLQERYEELNKHGIYIGDFNDDNFCLTDNGIKLYDIDNFRIDKLDFNVVNPAMMEYMNKSGNIKNIDYYCFNYFALSYLSSYNTDMILRGYVIKDFPSYLKTKEVLNFINFLENMNDNTIIERTKDGKQKTLLNIIK